MINLLLFIKAVVLDKKNKLCVFYPKIYTYRILYKLSKPCAYFGKFLTYSIGCMDCPNNHWHRYKQLGVW